MIRDATAEDIPQLLRLMRQLAEFEGYLDRFAIDEQSLLSRGFADSAVAEFSAVVVTQGDKLIGYALWYVTPFTFDLRPTIVLKELFVQSEARCSGVGDQLFRAVQQRGCAINARLLRWQVLPSNVRGMQFYGRLGGKEDNAWQHWVMEL